MTTFKATTEGSDKLGLRAVLERYANDQWMAVHYTDEQRVEVMLDQFKRQVQQELLVLKIESTKWQPVTTISILEITVSAARLHSTHE